MLIYELEQSVEIGNFQGRTYLLPIQRNLIDCQNKLPSEAGFESLCGFLCVMFLFVP